MSGVGIPLSVDFCITFVDLGEQVPPPIHPHWSALGWGRNVSLHTGLSTLRVVTVPCFGHCLAQDLQKQIRLVPRPRAQFVSLCTLPPAPQEMATDLGQGVVGPHPPWAQQSPWAMAIPRPCCGFCDTLKG